MDEETEKLVCEQMPDVQARHPNLELLRDRSGELWMRGGVGFSIEHDGHLIEDHYNLKFQIPDDYPASPPFVFETEDKIPSDFGHFMAAGNLCLGTPVEVQRQFAEHKSLLRFIDEQVVPYLFSYCYKRDHGNLPFGELRHGTVGLLQYYTEFFGVAPIEAMKLLKCLADDFAPPLMACPCGSELKLRDCHGTKLDQLRPFLPTEQFEMELREMIECATAAKIRLPESKIMPRKMWKRKRRDLRKAIRTRQRKG